MYVLIMYKPIKLASLIFVCFMINLFSMGEFILYVICVRFNSNFKCVFVSWFAKYLNQHIFEVVVGYMLLFHF